MGDPVKPQGAPGGAGTGAAAAAGNAADIKTGAAAGAQAAAGTEQAGKVPLAALHEEREKRRRIQEELDRTKTQLSQVMKERETGGQGQDPTDLAGIELPEVTQEELDGSDAKTINSKLRQIVTRAVSAGITGVTRRMAAVEGIGEVEKLLGQYEIFTDKDEPQLANDALGAALREVQALPKDAGREQVAAKIEEVAKRYSRYRGEREPKPEEEGAQERAPFGGGGSAEAAHMKVTYERPKTREEALKLSRKVTEDFGKARKTR